VVPAIIDNFAVENFWNMKHEIIESHDVQIIGMAKKIAFNEDQGTDIQSPDYQCGVMMPLE